MHFFILNTIDSIKVACFPEQGVHARQDAECWTAGWGSVTSSNQEPVQLQTLKVFMYDEYQCFNHSLDFADTYDYYDYYNYDNNNDKDSFVNHTYFDSEVEFCAGNWDGEGNGYMICIF